MKNIKPNTKEMEIIIETIEKMLPHGSGIDCDWKHKETDKTIRFTNSIHCMNDNGMYDGYQDFTVVIQKHEISDFKIHFNGKRRARYIESWRDCLEDWLYEALEEAKTKLKPMETYITAWPVDKKFQEKIGIYQSGKVKASLVGKTIHSLIKAGYTKINSFVEETSKETGKSIPRLTIHVQKEVL